MGTCSFFPTLILGERVSWGPSRCSWVPQSRVALVEDWEGEQETLCDVKRGRVPNTLTGGSDCHPPTGRFCNEIQSLLSEQAAGSEEVPSPTQPILEVRRGHGVTRGDTKHRLAQAATPHLFPQYSYEYSEAGERMVLGRGTYGVVYAGRCLSTQVRIAIKEIPERDSR